jgi:hypothetical protein
MAQAQITSTVNDLGVASMVPYCEIVIVYRPTPESEPTLRTISGMTCPARTKDGAYIVRAKDDAHPERDCSTFRCDRIEAVVCYHDSRTGYALTF